LRYTLSASGNTSAYDYLSVTKEYYHIWSPDAPNALRYPG